MKIPKDKWGFFKGDSQEAQEMHNNLPIVIRDENTGEVEIVDKYSWEDWLNDFSKPRYQRWAKIKIEEF